MSLLVQVRFSVPFSPDSEGSEHATFTAHVTESGLSGSVGTGTRNTRNTGNSASSTPRFSGVLMSLKVEDSMSLSSVLSHSGVNKRDNIVSNRGAENSGHCGIFRANGCFVS